VNKTGIYSYTTIVFIISTNTTNAVEMTQALTYLGTQMYSTNIRTARPSKELRHNKVLVKVKLY
jgi:hypothetical protein